MRHLARVFVLLALLGAAVLGYVARGAQTQTKTTTVVQIQTVAPPPPATKHLTAYVTGPNNGCLSSDVSHSNAQGDTFTLRTESNGIKNRNLLAIADSHSLDAAGCNLVLHFSISPNLGFFYVSDDTSGGEWGPFDSHKLAADGYRLRLYYNP